MNTAARWHHRCRDTPLATTVSSMQGGDHTSVAARVSLPGRHRLTVPARQMFAVLLAALLVSAMPLTNARSEAAANPTTITCRFIDPSRSVPDFATQPPSVASRTRPLPTTVWLPPRTVPSQPRPLVLFAAGYDSYPSRYAPLLSAWAKAGFVVAAPTFPDENPASVVAQRTNTEGDLANEPADLAFVARSLEGDSSQRSQTCPGIFGRLEPNVLVVAGHSDGAVATALFAFGTGSDPRGVPMTALRVGLSLRGALIFSGAKDGLGPFGAPNPDVPMLMVQSAGDQCNPERDAVTLFRSIGVDERFFLLLRTAHHLPPFNDTDKAAFAVVDPITTRFIRLAARGAHIGDGFISYADRDPPVGAMYPNPPVTPALLPSCGPT